MKTRQAKQGRNPSTELKNIPSMVGDEDEGVEEMTDHAVERPAVREAPVTTASIHTLHIQHASSSGCICMHGHRRRRTRNNNREKKQTISGPRA